VWELGKYIQFSDGTSGGKGPLGTPRNRWKDIINTAIKTTGCKGVECVYVAWDGMQLLSLVNKKMKLLFQSS
jgi:hypothetical protein